MIKIRSVKLGDLPVVGGYVIKYKRSAMHEDIDFYSNKSSNTLFVLLSGITGGKDELLIKYLEGALKSRGSVLRVQFANDPTYHSDTLPDITKMSFEHCFSCMDRAFEIASGTKHYSNIIFVAHSFSAVIATYYLGLHKPINSLPPRYTLVVVDSDPSPRLLEVLDIQGEESFSDHAENPFHSDVMQYMREHDSAALLETLPATVIKIDASVLGVDHEFTAEESKRRLLNEILKNLRSAL